MGILENALKKAIKNQVNKRFKPVSKSKLTNSREFALAMREIREKQELADRMRTQAKIQSQQLLKIANDCAELVNTTVNPEVFFMRYNLMLENLEKLVGLECTGIFENSAELPSVAFSRIEAQFTAATNDFLERSFEKTKEHAKTLKSESGKTNAIKRYFDNMEKYIIHMSSESLEHFDKMKETYLKGIE